jgi:ribosomal protein L40E
VDNKMLELYGLKPKDEGLKNEIQVCQRCQSNNSPVSKFCNRCGSALNLKVALETDQRVSTAGEVMEALLNDPEVKGLLAEKMRSLGLAEKLSQP